MGLLVCICPRFDLWNLESREKERILEETPFRNCFGVAPFPQAASFNARNYGTLSAIVTFSNGKITNVSASQSPLSWSDKVLSTLIPFVNNDKITIEQIKENPAAQLPCGLQNSCRSQASYTADAFWSSVQSAITKANL